MATAVKIATDGPVEARKAPMIDPRTVTLDSAGMLTRRWFVRLPEGMILDDLKTPDIWGKVQKNAATSLQRHDYLYIVGYAEDFAAEGYVVDANGEAVSIHITKNFELKSRIKSLLNDGKFHVEWRGTGYVVIRNGDGRECSQPTPSLAAAERDLANQYPRAV